MKVAFCIRPEYSDGGDGIQALKTREFLIKNYEIAVDILTQPNLLNSSYDIVHILNYATTEISKNFFNKALELNLKIVSSPIYWDYSLSIMPLYMYFWFNKKFITERFVKFHQFFHPILSLLPRSIVKDAYTNVSKRFKKDISFFINHSNLILPNSIEEGNLCCNFAGLKDAATKIRVVYNGVDINDVKILDKETFFNKYKIPHNYILQVGRIEYLKNQINLISSMMEYPNIPLVFVGKANEKRPYTHEVRKLAKKRGNVFFFDNIPHSEVYSFFHYARVHVLLSMRESPGLVNLEALSQECPIVISDERCLPVNTYFQDNYISVNPFNREAITKAILDAYQMKHKKNDLSNFSWDMVATQTYNAYLEILTN